jgi:hypothetical protein
MILAEMAELANVALQTRMQGMSEEINPNVFVPNVFVALPTTVTSHDFGSSSSIAQMAVAAELTRMINILTREGFLDRELSRRWQQSTGPTAVTYSAVVEISAPAERVRSFVSMHLRPASTSSGEV